MQGSAAAPGSLNAFGYALGNPLAMTDPAGTCPIGLGWYCLLPTWDPGAPVLGSPLVDPGRPSLESILSDPGMPQKGSLLASSRVDGYRVLIHKIEQTDEAGADTDDAIAGAGPDFVVTATGKVIIIPAGATGPTDTRAPGQQYVGGVGGHGLDRRVWGLRIMDPDNVYPFGRATYMNMDEQTVDPYTGRTVLYSDPLAHIGLEP